MTMPQEAKKGKSWGGTSMQANKRTLWVFTDLKLMKNRGTKCTFILVVVRPTVVQNSFHTEFLSSIRFSPLRLLWRRKRTRNFLTFSSELKEELKLSLPTTKANWWWKPPINRTVRGVILGLRVRVSCVHVSFVQLKSHGNSHYRWQLAGNFN